MEEVEKPIEYHEPPKKKPRKPVTKIYENVSRRNIFTSKGRCMAGERVELTPDEANPYGDKLKSCPK
jgi:hypothetical protein